MYGLLLESIYEYLKQTYGENVAEEIRKRANIHQHSFVTHKVYSETLVPRMGDAAAAITGTPKDELMEQFGVAFVTFVGHYGYDRVLRVLGRHMRDFLNGLDNLHEYLRFSYAKLKPPSFFCENETKEGLTLHYRSKRKGFLHYVKGQIKTVGSLFYNTHVEIDVISHRETEDLTHVVFQLKFDNYAYREPVEKKDITQTTKLHVRSAVFFDVFPFHLVFNRDMLIRSAGKGLEQVLEGLEGRQVDTEFVMMRPLLEFTWKNVMSHTNNVFELQSVNETKAQRQQDLDDLSDDDVCSFQTETASRRTRVSRASRRISYAQSQDCGTIYSQPAHDQVYNSARTSYLRLKGQMMFMEEWDSILFLGTPIMENLDVMFTTGLYINDLSMHDSSRDLVLAGTQQSAELKLALDQEQQKNKKLEETMRKLDAEMKKTDSLLYQMIPKSVADRLRKGEPAMNTCEVFESVTILFSDVVGFTTICSQITPMQVVGMLNAMYTEFDQLSEKNQVYKVETIGDAYMVVAGAPIKTKYHAHHICNMAFDMLDAMSNLTDPSTGGNMRIRVGVHSGAVVAGVVGMKMPRYCLFGDTVNTASRMESTGEAMKLHVSETTKQFISSGDGYVLQERGSIQVKGKGSMKTYWLMGIPGHDPAKYAELARRGSHMPPLENGKHVNGFDTLGPEDAELDGLESDKVSLVSPPPVPGDCAFVPPLLSIDHKPAEPSEDDVKSGLKSPCPNKDQGKAVNVDDQRVKPTDVFAKGAGKGNGSHYSNNSLNVAMKKVGNAEKAHLIPDTPTGLHV
ncbi:soluble guanylate cyclase 88E isoform X3 [Lingula anatina]|uniref:guanylate cyclase n=1 Tax=Lingula anatina TaxID=7574 RepID=A0A1S3JJR0_LINAN|nr:soluble guanylate cyclase 88E isoform X3 [Lingula anatina]|eukprot:XP_013410650.1 soluble guanylate cyclase 88E isoform X3 [Lingula anatina]